MQILSQSAVAVLGLSLNQAAFSSEIIRGGILSVDQGQLEAAAALGLPRWRQVFRIVLPQAMRSIIPGGFNEVIGLAKGTSMVYVLALPELFYTVQVIYQRNMEVIPLLMVATFWYIIILSGLSIVQVRIERHFARGALRTMAPTAGQRLHSWLKRSVRAPAATPASPPPAAPSSPGKHAQWPHGTGGDVRIEGVSKCYGTHWVLQDVDLHVRPGEVMVILGPSGSGKSTLLRTINALEKVDSGAISVDGEFIGYRRQGNTLYELKEKDVLKRRAAVGMVFQAFNLFPHMTVLDNIAEGPVAVRGQSREQARGVARDLLARVGLSDRESAYPRQLSGGQQQRVAIARTLALAPRVLLFDEPTSALDPELVGEVLEVIRELARSGTTLIIVTHEIGFAREVADRVVFMDAGRILEQGPPSQVLSAPSQPRTQEFLAKVL
jgi:polar amino acid transport system permease protein